MRLRRHARQSRRGQAMLIWFFLTALGWVGITPNSSADHNWTEQIAAFKPMVVNVETSSEIVFEAESPGTNFA
ncbi:hypothetical protein HYR99_03820, partial [Candidatus Poribacteria bacterium]|nr:hypothetical protein [Candidatus Poribacteria bacterium]